MPMASEPTYPYGLCISLDHDALVKLGLSESPEIGDMIDVRALGKVTSCSISDGESGHSCRTEIQLMFLALENEEHEDDDAEEAPKPARSKRYGR